MHRQPPATLSRHQLVQLSPAGWQQVLARDWHEAARPCLAHWAAHDLPLVVTRQPELHASAADTLHLGLPAPTCWQRQRLSLAVARSAVLAQRNFPDSADITAQLPPAAQAAWCALGRKLRALGLHAQVYGSHGWQHLTGLAYVRPQSDLDLFVPVPDAHAADAAAALLADATAALLAEAGIDSPRLDGELGLADGSAVAWREWRDWRAGRVAKILVKRVQGVALESGRTWLHAGRHASDEPLQRIGRAATVALYDELALAPKPGLVSFVDSGSHADMDAATFMRSLFALRHYFAQITALGARQAAFAELEQAGIAAERRMLRATAGINTHRGAVFSLGMLCAAAGRLVARGEPLAAAALRRSLVDAWGPALRERCTRPSDSNGRRAALRHGLRGVGEEAASGFPVLFEVALPTLRQALADGLNTRHARLQTLFAVMAALDDTNLAHRGGLAGLRHAQQAAAGFLADGGAARPDAMAHAQAIHHDFVARRLSPGGAADVLAAACWVHKVCAST